MIAKCILESDVIILNLLEERNWQTEYIIELLKHKCQDESLNNDQHNHTFVIGIGSHLTWAHSNKKIEMQSGVDK